MKRFLAFVAFALAFGCNDQHVVDKITLDAASLKGVLRTNSDFQNLVSLNVSQNQQMFERYQNLSSESKAELSAVIKKFNSAEDAALNATDQDKKVLSQFSTTNVGKPYVTLTTALKAKYNFQMADFADILAEEIAEAQPSTLKNGRTTHADPCNCVGGASWQYYQTYMILTTGGVSATDADRAASTAYSYFYAGCMYACGQS